MWLEAGLRRVNGGKRLNVDLGKADLKKLQELNRIGEAATTSETARKCIRVAYHLKPRLDEAMMEWEYGTGVDRKNVDLGPMTRKMLEELQAFWGLDISKTLRATIRFTYTLLPRYRKNGFELTVNRQRVFIMF
jgi:hypothetical protein